MVVPAGSVPRLQGNVEQGPVVDTKVNSTGTSSSSRTAAAADAPALCTVRVYVMWAPATTFAGPVVVTDRSARSSIGSMSVAMAGVGSDVPAAGTTRAVFSIVSPKAGSAVPVAVNVAAPVTGTVTIALMLPVPVAAP